MWKRFLVAALASALLSGCVSDDATVIEGDGSQLVAVPLVDDERYPFDVSGGVLESVRALDRVRFTDAESGLQLSARVLLAAIPAGCAAFEAVADRTADGWDLRVEPILDDAAERSRCSQWASYDVGHDGARFVRIWYCRS